MKQISHQFFRVFEGYVLNTGYVAEFLICTSMSTKYLSKYLGSVSLLENRFTTVCSFHVFETKETNLITLKLILI